MSPQAISPPRGVGASAFPAVRRALTNALVYAIALILAAIVIVPLAYVVLGGFRTTGDTAAQPVALPQIWRISNYVEIITSSSFWWQVFNSTAIAVGATVVVVAFGALAAFPLARMSFRGRDAIYTFFTLGLLFPIGVSSYSTQYPSDTARILAFTALSMLPALAFFLAAERRIVGGLSGAVKG